MFKPKVLIVSHNPLSDSQSNGKTITSLLSFIPKDNLAQLYFTMDTPDFTICENFFRVTDLDVLKNFFLLEKNIGKKITYDESLTISSDKSRLHSSFFYNTIRKLFVAKISVLTTIRDFVWRNSYYFSDKFSEWLDDFNPDIVFFQSSNCNFAFNFVKDICDKKGIKVIMQTTDDYLSYRYFGLFFNYNVYKLKQSYKEINNYTKLILPISSKMENYYNKMYPNNYYVTMNSVSLASSFKYHKIKKPSLILYAGNLGLGRWKTIYKLAKIINEIGAGNFKIEVYSIETPSNKIIKKLNKFDCCKYCYSLDKEQLYAKRQQADFLLHVESFDYINRHLTRYSISTKIPELMNSCKPILAIGPSDIASIEYLKDNKAAYVIDSFEKKYFYNSINNFIKKNTFRKNVEKAFKCVKENHNIDLIQKFLEKYIEENFSFEKEC